MDVRTKSGQPVFAHVMTTSNHRPFTYPEGKIDIPSGSGRDGAVKYSDYAIGVLIAEAKKRAWFDNTIFVFIADHTSIARNRADLPLERYHIPWTIYAPKLISPRTIDWVASQIDVAPTLLGLINLPYTSQFFGRDVLRDGPNDGHVFMANYQTVGLVDEGVLVELRPRRSVKVTPAPAGTRVAYDVREAEREAIATYQVAARVFSGRTMPRPARD